MSLPMYDVGLQLLGVRNNSWQIDVCVAPTDSVTDSETSLTATAPGLLNCGL